MKNCISTLVVLFALVTSNVFGGTIATFSDPALSATTPLFTVNDVTKTVSGGWLDSQTGLDLQVVLTGNTFNNAFFTMTPLSYTGSLNYAVTGAGTIRFFADNADPLSATPILQIDFDNANITFGGLGGDNLFSSNGVKFSGSEIGSLSLSEEVFAFSFANLKALNPASPKLGYSATAAFTSSAIVPEPATLAILGLGSITLIPRRKFIR
jgi:hypothetical protein